MKVNRPVVTPGQTEIFEIRIDGHLQDKWSERFEGMTITREINGTTTLKGALPDQTALHSILIRIRDMNIKLLSVNLVVNDMKNNSQKKQEVDLSEITFTND